MHILLFFILIALIFPGLLRFIMSLVGLAIICVIIVTAAHAGNTICEKAAAYQVSGEPGMHQCLSHKTISADCHAVMMASMNKRIHECESARKFLQTGDRKWLQ